MIVEKNITEKHISENKISEKLYSQKPKKNNYFPFGLVFLIIAIFVAILYNSNSDEEYLAKLIIKIETKQELSEQEMFDYCHFLYVLRDSISSECVCILDGIDWENPPKNPDFLSEDWKEITHPHQALYSNTRVFVHKKYNKIRISFDKAKIVNQKTKAYEAKDHWHRFNPNSQKIKYDYYLDFRGANVGKGSDKSHILTKP